jgi:hypothetical protein
VPLNFVARTFMVGMVLMWLATISREPGGLGAFAAQVAATESQLGAGAAALEDAVLREQVREAAQYEEMCQVTDEVPTKVCRAIPTDLDFIE